MKKFTFAIAAMALILASCDKTGDNENKPAQSDYEKTILSFTSNFSEDYLQFFEVRIEGKTFDGDDINLAVTGNGTYKIETGMTAGETAIHAYSYLKNPMPEIDTARTYTFSSGLNGTIRAKVKDKEAFSSMQSFEYTTGTSSSTLSGKKLINNTAFFERRTFDKTIRFTIAGSGNSVSVGATTVTDN